MFLLRHFLFALVASAHPLAQHKTLPNGLVVSYTGKCGSQNGQTCLGSRYGDSCSKWGFCGSGPTFSGPGCLHEYGKCDGVVQPLSTKTVTAPSTTQSTVNVASVPGLPTNSALPTPSAKPKRPQNSSDPTGDAFIQGPASSGDSSSPSQTGNNAPSSTNNAASNPSRRPFAVVFNNGKPVPVPPEGFIAESPGDPTATAPPSGWSGTPGGSDGPGDGNGDDPSDPSHGQPGDSGKIPPRKPYKMYTGDGDQGWPTMDQWYSFDAIWEANLFKINISCQGFNTINNSPAETAEVRAALLDTAKSTGLDERFVLAVMLQESQGCVRVPTTNYGVSNPGLFQSHAGQGTCNSMGQVQHPCPESEIKQMVQDGVGGTPQGMGLKQTVAKATGSGAAKFYRGARIYNSGSVAPSGDLGEGVATHCYATDVANRLTGWTSKTKNGCPLDRGY